MAPAEGSNVHPEAQAIVESFKDQFEEYHALVEGRVVAIHDLFNSIAVQNGKPMLPPPAIAFLLDLREDQAQKEGGPIVTPDQLLRAFMKMVPAKDTREIFDDKVMSHVRDAIKRIKHAKKVMPELKPDLTELHTKEGDTWQCGGDADKLFAWFKDLLPEDAEFPKEAFLGMIMRVPPNSPKVALETFLQGISTNMDESDTVEKLRTCVKKHLPA